MDAFSLFAKITLDSSEFDKGLEKAENSAKGVGSKLGTALGNMGSSIKSGLETIAKVSVAAVSAATAAVGAFAKSAIDTGMEFDTAMSQVAATLGLTMDEMESKTGSVMITLNGQTKEFTGTLREFAREMGRNTKFTATEAADALNYMALAGYDAQTSMEMLPNVLNLAAAGAMDLARASDMVTDTQTAFGISLERTALMVDEMAKAASTGNTNVEQLGDAFLVVGGLAKELNGGFIATENGAQIAVDGVQELEIALTAMANAGIKGSEAGTHMRNMLLKLSDPTEQGTIALENMGVTIFDTEGKMKSLNDIFGDLTQKMSEMTQEEKIATIGDLFNTRDIASAEALLASVEGEMVRIGDETYSVGTAFEKWGDDIYDSSKGFEIVRTSWDEIGQSIADARIPLEDVKKAVEDTGIAFEGSEKDFEWFVSNIRTALTTQGESVEEATERMANAWDMSMEDARIAVEAVEEAINNTTGAAQKMADTQLDNLEGDITKFKSALSDAKIEISDQLSPSLRDFVQFGTSGVQELTEAFQSGGLSEAMDVFGRLLSEGLNMIIDSLPDWVDAGMKLLEALGQGILDNLDTIIDAAIDIIGALGEGIIKALPALVEGGLQIILKLAEALNENLPEIIPSVVAVLEKISEILIENLPLLIESAAEIIYEIAMGMADALPELIPTIVDVILAITEGLIDNVDLLIDAAIEIIMALANGIINALPRLLEKAPVIIEKLHQAIVRNLPKLLESAAELIKKLVSGIIDNLPKIARAAGEIISSFVNNIIDLKDRLKESADRIMESFKDGIMNFIHNAGDWGRDLVDNFIDGISGAIGRVRDVVSDIAETVRSYLHFSEPDIGPLKDFHTYAPDMMKLFAKGIDDNSSLVTDEVEKAFDFSDVIASQTVNVGAGIKAGGSPYSGTVTINVYGAEGQSEERLAELVERRLLHNYNMQRTVGAAYA